MDETKDYINSKIDGDMLMEISYDSTINFTINGTIITNILNLDTENNKNIIVFENNENSLIILMNQYDNDNNNLTKNIWNWKVLFCLLLDNYYVIDEQNPIVEKTILSKDYRINGLDSLKSFYNILYNNLDWKTFKKELKNVSKNPMNSKETLEQAIETALRIILIGNQEIKITNIITEIDGENIYCHNIDTLSLCIYNYMESCAKQGKTRYLLFQFTDFIKKQKKKHDYTNTFVVDGIPLSYLLTNGLLDRLNNLFESKTSGLNVVYEKKVNIAKVWIEW
jgi:hypothetical protein